MESRDQRVASAWGLLVVVCLAAPWATRALLLGEKELSLRWIDLRGVVGDASVALCVVGLLGVLLRTPRWWGRGLAWLVVMAFVLGSFAIYEIVSVFDSLYALNHIEYLADATFVSGSVLHTQHPFLLGVLASGATGGVVWARVPGSTWWRGWGAVLATCVVLYAVLPMSHYYDGWRQRHAVHAQLSVLPASAKLGHAGTIGAEVGEVFRADLRGERRAGPLTNQPNVLLIMIEGASGASLPSVAQEAGVESQAAMPKLDARAKHHILLSQVVSHQRQTNRGEYGILCGDYPKLLTDQSKMTEQVYGDARRCLPAVLRDAGYATVYVQAAPLSFMLKDQFMKKAGFDELIGDAWFERSYARTDWGVDDKAFFEQALERIAELHAADRPFFATMLTVGTHHPFTFPEGESERSTRDRRAAAFRWADDALDAFLDELGRRGVLEDTVVIVTSDESAGWITTSSAVERLLAQSWSFAVVMLPVPMADRVDAMYAHVDTALSVTDLLGMESEASGFLGRSWFRRYATPRAHFAGNTYARRVFMLHASGATVICDERFRDCERHGKGAHRFTPEERGRPARPRERRLLAEVARLTRSGRSALRQSDFMTLLTADDIVVRAAEGKKLLAGGQYLRVPAGTVVSVDFDLEVRGDHAAASLSQDVFLDGYEKFARQGVVLRSRQRWRLRYELGVPLDSSQLVVQLYATAVEGESATLHVHEARLSMRKENATSEDPVVIIDRVSPADPR